MSRGEFLAWVEFYRLYPFDDYHRIHRPAALIATSMSGTKLDELLEWLQPSRSPQGFTSADMATMRALGFKPPK